VMQTRPMPTFDSNNPPEFGWTDTPRIVPYSFAGHRFYNGLDERVVPVFDLFFKGLSRMPGFAFHAGLGPGDGDWGYEQRNIGGSGTKSFHDYGLACDTNAPWNPQFMQNPPPGPYRLPNAVDGLALSLGLLWGGNARFGPDWDRMHVENHNSPAECLRYARPAGPAPFPLLHGQYFGPQSAGQGAVTGAGVWAVYSPAVRRIQEMVGVPMDGVYGPVTAGGAGSWQSHNHLRVDGLVGPITWGVMGL
jgi:peptidoglycan hydrolase-like protein with peptidoglycan-binding domain